jgi:hypothetical protein
VGDGGCEFFFGEEVLGYFAEAFFFFERSALETHVAGFPLLLGSFRLVLLDLHLFGVDRYGRGVLGLLEVLLKFGLVLFLLLLLSFNVLDKVLTAQLAVLSLLLSLGYVLYLLGRDVYLFGHRLYLFLEFISLRSRLFGDYGVGGDEVFLED